MAGPGSSPIRNNSAPVSGLDRIPLRKVNAGGCILYDYERQFFVDLLTTNRMLHEDPPDKPEFAAFLYKNECSFWNKLVDNLTIKRYLVKDAQGAIAKGAIPNLILTANLRALFGEPLCSDGGSVPRNCISIPPSLGFDRYFQAVEVEVAGIETPSLSPYLALAGDRGEVNPQYYVHRVVPPILFTFVRVDLNGVSARNAMFEEAQWSLREWEESMICGSENAPTRISRVVLQSDANRRSKAFLIRRDQYDIKATHSVHYTFLQSGPVVRDVRPITGDHWYNQEYLYNQAFIDQADLAKLTMADVKRLDWESASPGGNSATTKTGIAKRTLPASCSPR